MTPWPALSDEQLCEMDQAVAMLREAANQGHMEVQAYYGNLYHFGRGVAQDDRLAFLYYEKAAQQGHAECQSFLAAFYFEGKGCEQSYERAAGWFKRAASTGHMQAQFMLAGLHELGDGVAMDYLEARRLYALSSAQGLAHATEYSRRESARTARSSANG